VVSYGFGEAGFAMNRREPTAKGIRIGVNPSGPSDHQVPVLLVASPDGQRRAILFAYACHNTTLTGDSYELSGDYAGVAAVKTGSRSIREPRRCSFSYAEAIRILIPATPWNWPSSMAWSLPPR